jgi:hypothetical protein
MTRNEYFAPDKGTGKKPGNGKAREELQLFCDVEEIIISAFWKRLAR